MPCPPASSIERRLATWYDRHMRTSNTDAWCVAALSLAMAFCSVGCGDKKPPPKAPTSDLMDSDGDGVGDKEDKCPSKKEDRKAPNPNDGCPKED